MFIVTAKLNKKKLLGGIILAAIILCAAIIVIGSASKKGNKNSADPDMHQSVKSNNERIEYLKQFGWEVSDEPIETLEITIPREFPEVYKKYNEVQLKQGFDLSEYGGMKATRYTYRILNYPSNNTDVVADIIVCNDCVIAGNIQSTALDGFMHGLKGDG